ncbi:hypothetical protein Tco_0389079 [Tanacetum coccineum]
MSTSNQQTLADSGANERPPMLEKENYIPWESRFRRHLDNKLEDGERMWNSIHNGSYKRPMITNPDNDQEEILEPFIQSKKAAKNHDPLALLAHLNASSSQSHASSSNSLQPYYVTRPSSVVDYKDEYQGELQGYSQKDKLIAAMMLLARAITQNFSTPTNNRLCTSSNIRSQAVVQDGRVDIQTKNAGYGGNGNNAGRQNRNQAFNTRNRNDDSNPIVQRVPRTESTLRKPNVQCYNGNEKGH